MRALQILTEEHQTFAAILHAIQFMINEIRAGRLQPDMKLIRAMIRYLEAYPEKRHHPKEDRLLFSRLRARTSEGAVILDHLFADHAAAAERIRALEQAMDEYESRPGDISQFEQSFRRYAEFYRHHMLIEEHEILPLLRRHLTEEDWAEIDAAFVADDPMHGCDGEDFTAIYSRLVAAAPPPLGLGAGPYQG